MAKRRPKPQDEHKIYTFLSKYQPLLIKLAWGFVIGVCIYFGYLKGYPIVAEGRLGEGILIGLAYGGGALIAILISLFLNRKLKGL